MTSSGLLDAAGRRRSPATLPGYLGGRAPRNKGAPVTLGVKVIWGGG